MNISNDFKFKSNFKGFWLAYYNTDPAASQHLLFLGQSASFSGLDSVTHHDEHSLLINSCSSWDSSAFLYAINGSQSGAQTTKKNLSVVSSSVLC